MEEHKALRRAIDEPPRKTTEGYAYSVHLKRRGNIICFEDSFLPHILISDRALGNMRCRVVEKLGLCEDCQVAYQCHVIMWVTRDGGEVGEKYCPVLFQDALRPKWKVKELV